MSKQAKERVDMKKTNKEMKVSWVDDLIGVFSQRAKFERIRFKFASNIIKRKYEGADCGRRTGGWKTASTSANKEISGAMVQLRNRARDLVRNNPYASKGLQVIESNVIDHGIMTQFKSKTKSIERNVNLIWKTWAGTTAIDYDGMNNFAGLQRLVTRSMAEGGECLVRLRNVGRQTAIGPDGVEREVPPIQLQVLEGDFLKSDKLVKEISGNKIIQGVEFNEERKRIAYHLYKEHPGGVGKSIRTSFETNRIEADKIAHIYRIDRAGQIRGVTWFAPTILRMRDFDEYEDAQLVRQKIAAMFTAFVHDLSGIDPDISEQERQEELGEKMEPGLIEILPTGKDIKLSNPPTVENYKEYTSVVLHSIAAGLGITYESLTSDYSEVNYSSARQAKLEMYKNINTWQKQIIVPQFLQHVVRWYINSLKVMGVKTGEIVTAHTMPRRDLVDPTKEIPALKTAVRSGFTTLSDAIRQAGSDPEQHFAEIKSDNERIDELDLTLDSDPRKVQSTSNK